MLLLLAPERALFCCLFQILFYAGRIITSLTVSTMPGIHEYLPSYAYFSKLLLPRVNSFKTNLVWKYTKLSKL